VERGTSASCDDWSEVEIGVHFAQPWQKARVSRLELLNFGDPEHSTLPNLTSLTMWSLPSCLSLALLLSQAQALYFYIDGPTQKCFFEDLPKDTMVVGKDRTDRIGRCKI
jgi:hypothetical protein